MKTKLAQYSANDRALTTIIARVSAQQNRLGINSQRIGPDFAAWSVRGELTFVTGEEICVVGSDKEIVEAIIFWMYRPGVEFELHNAGIVFPDSEIPDDNTVLFNYLECTLKTED